MDFVQRLKPSLSWSEEDVDDVLQAYSETNELPAGGTTHWYWAARKLGTDCTMICPAHRSAQWLYRKRRALTRVPLFVCAPTRRSKRHLSVCCTSFERDPFHLPSRERRRRTRSGLLPI